MERSPEGQPAITRAKEKFLDFIVDNLIPMDFVIGNLHGAYGSRKERREASRQELAEWESRRELSEELIRRAQVELAGRSEL